MRAVRIEIEVPWTLAGVRVACAALTTANRLYLRSARLAGRPVPPLYKSGVRYRAPFGGVQKFKPIPKVLVDGHGGCARLACWRAAELQEAGERARAVPIQITPRLMHIVVRRGNGTLEDPSRRLGMRG